MTLEDKSITTDSSLFLSNYSCEEIALDTLENYSLANNFCINLNNSSLINCISVMFIKFLYNLEKYLKDHYSFIIVDHISFTDASNYHIYNNDNRLDFDYFTIIDDKYSYGLLCL